MKSVCFFDIDGTLLNSGGAGQHAMEMALADVFGVNGPYTDIPAAGRTDRAIVADLFNHHQLTVTEDQLQQFMQAYLRHLPKSLALKQGSVLPGITNLLAELHEREEIALGLLTGNFEIGAQAKLSHFQLDHYFRFGGYGDLHLERDDVARMAHSSACEFLCGPIDADRVWVIGDTPADVRCARAIGARVIAVATGIYSAEELEPSQPDHLYATLEDVDSVLELLCGSVCGS